MELAAERVGAGQTADRRLTVEEAAKHIGSSISFLNRARLTGGGPVFYKIGRNVRYERADLDEWLRSRRRRSTSDVSEAA